MAGWSLIVGRRGIGPVVAVALSLPACRPPGVDPPGDAAVLPPVAPPEPVTFVLHGRTFVDAYAWLRDRDDPRTRAYLEAENAFAAATLAPLAPLHDAVLAELRARVVGDDADAPVRHGPWAYTTRRVAGGEHWISERAPVAGGPTQVVLDANARAKGHPYYDVSGFEVSPDHTRLAWSEDTRGDERYRVIVIDLASGRTIDAFDDATGGQVTWSADSRTLWTTALDDAHREYQVWRRQPGVAGAPVLSYQEDDPRYSVTIGRSRDDRWLQLAIASGVTSEVRVMDASRPADPWRVIEPRREGIEYEIAHHGQRLFLRTNDGAPEFAVHEATITADGHTPWRPFAAPGPGESFTGVDAFADHVVITGRGGGLPQIWIHPLRPGAAAAPHAIAWPDAAYEVFVGDNPEFASTSLRVEYSSPLVPPSTLAYDMDARTSTVLDRDPVPDFDPGAVVVERLAAVADDGTSIPVTVVRRADAARPAPLVLQGYGAYGSSWDVGFVRSDLPLLDRGVTIAIAHVRGGGELGKAWHDGGKLANKPNTFTDFIRAAEFLVERGETTPGSLAIQGGSAGGLLVGAVVNLRPELFAAAVAEVPFVDVINTMRDGSLPLTAGEWEEWGNPTDPAQLAVMAGYSPYDNVAARDYPAMLVTAGLHDPRVGYWEPAKWVARLRALGGGDGPLLLRTQMDAGHSGGSGRYAALGDRAWVLTFVLDRIARGAPRR